MDYMAEGVFFKPFRKVNTVAGLEIRNWLKVLVVLCVGISLCLMTGLITVEVDEGLQASEVNIYKNQLTEARKVRKTLETRTEFYLNGIQNPTPEQRTEATNKAVAELSDSQLESVEIAKQYKIEADTTDEQISDLVPRTKKVTQPAIPDIARVVVFIVVPLVLTIIWYLDLKGWSYSTEAKRFLKFRKRQSLYVNKHKLYLYGEQ